MIIPIVPANPDDNSSNNEKRPNTGDGAGIIPDSKLKTATLTAGETNEGILVNFDVPEDAKWCKVFIGDIMVYSDYTDDFKTNPSVLYPLVEDGKEYTLRITFGYDEQKNGYITVPNVVVAWNEITVKAKGGLGELSATAPEISVSQDGSYRITTKPVFSNNTVLSSDRSITVQLFAGVVPDSEDYAKIGQKYLGEVALPVNTETADANDIAYYKVYDECFLVYYVGCKHTDSNSRVWNYRISPGGIKEGIIGDELIENNATLTAKETDEGILVEFTAPATADKYELTVGNVYIPYMGLWDDTKTAEGYKGLLVYPFVENKKEYNVILTFKDSSGKQVAFAKKKVKANGGLGEFVKTTSHDFSVDKANGIVKMTKAADFSNPNLVSILNRIEGCSFRYRFAFYGSNWVWYDCTYINADDLDKPVYIYEHIETPKVVDIVQFKCVPLYKSEILDRTWEYQFDCNNDKKGLNMKITAP